MPETIVPVTVSRAFVLAKCSFFTDVQLWPRAERLNAKAWLDNFIDPERQYAEHLLHAFLYFSEDLSDQLFKSAFQHLSTLLLGKGDSTATLQDSWDAFRQKLVVTHVTGETPNHTDSGYIFVRKARQLLRIEQTNVMGPGQALVRLRESHPPPIIFFDDFVGTGDQFIRTWNRTYRVATGSISSFAKEALRDDVEIFYCPLLCTAKGFGQLRKNCPGLKLYPAHLLSAGYSAVGKHSMVWPAHLSLTAASFIETASRRAGIPRSHTLGHGDLALSLAFSHSVPDATLPLFYHETSSWNPLIRRS